MRKKLFKREFSKVAGTLSGKLLIAHPLQDDDKFSKTLLFVETDTGNGISGIILNRPLNIMLKALGKNFENLSVSNAPVYSGGSDCEATVMLTAWVVDKYKKVFEIYYALDGDDAQELIRTKENIQFRAFLGASNFDKSIYDDIENGLWIVSAADKLFGAREHETALWQKMLLKESPNALLYS